MIKNTINNLVIYKAKLKWSIWLHEDNIETVSDDFYVAFKNTLVDVEKAIMRLKVEQDEKQLPCLSLWNRD